MGITFLVLCTICFAIAVFLSIYSTVEEVPIALKVAKIWICIAAANLVLAYLYT